MNLRRTVAIALSLTLASTVLVSGAFLSRSSADEGDQPPAQFLQDRPNEPTVQGEVAAPPRSVEAVPTPDAPSRETPKGDGKKRDWFLKNDAKSQADAIADEIELRNQPGSQADAKLTVPPVRPGAAVRVVGSGKSTVLRRTRDEARAERVAEGDPVVDLGEPQARTTRPQTPTAPAVQSSIVPKRGSLTQKGDPMYPLLPGQKTPPDLPTPPLANGRTKTFTVSPVGVSAPAPKLTVTPTGFEASLKSGKIVFSDGGDVDGALRYELGDGRFVGLRPLKGKKVAPVAVSDGVKWTGLVDGNDLVEYPTANGTKGEIVLTRPPDGVPVWDFELVLSDGLRPSLRELENVPAANRPLGYNIYIVDTANQVVATLPIGDSIDAVGAKSGVDVALRHARNDRWIVSYGADEHWLKDPARKYPVRVDPTVSGTFSGPVGATFATPGTVAAFDPYDPNTPASLYSAYYAYVDSELVLYFGTTPWAGYTISSATLNFSVGNCDRGPHADNPYPLVIGAAFLQDGTAGAANWNSPIVGYESQSQIVGSNTTANVAIYPSAGTVSATGPFAVRLRMEGPSYCHLWPSYSMTITATNDPPAVNRLPIPNGFAASAPADGATGVALSPTLAVNPGFDQDGDQLQYLFIVSSGGQTALSGWSSSTSWSPVFPYSTAVSWSAYVSDGAPGVLIGSRSFTTLAPATNSAPTIVQTAPANGAGPIGIVTGGVAPVTLSVNVTDPNNDAMNVQFTAVSTTTGIPSQSGSIAASAGGGASFTFNAAAGNSYYWYASVVDTPTNGTAAITVTSGNFTFTVTKRANSSSVGLALVTKLANAAYPPNDGEVRVNPAGLYLAATASDPDGDPLQYNFNVCPAGGSCITSGWIDTGTWAPPQLSFNTTYTWYASVHDIPPATANPSSGDVGPTAQRTFTTSANTATPISAPSLVLPASPSSTTTLPWLQVSMVDPDVGDTVQYQFKICAGDFGVESQCLVTPWQASPMWHVPSQLNWGVTYQWRAAARNGSDTTNAIGLESPMWTIIPNTPAVNSYDTLSTGLAPFVDMDGNAIGAVNEALGEFTSSTTDASVASVGPSVSIDRTYLSDVRKRFAFGRNWVSNLDYGIYSAVLGASPGGNEPVVLFLPGGRREYFSKDANTSLYVPSNNGTYADLSKQADGTYKYVSRNTTIMIFDVGGALRSIQDRSGNAVTYTRDSMNRVSQIIDEASKRSLTITYNADGFVDKIETPPVAAHGSAPLTWTYKYDPANKDQLREVCPPSSAAPVLNGCYVYAYTNNRLTKITNPRGFIDQQVIYDNTAFSLGAPNMFANGSFEDASISPWLVSEGPTTGSASTTPAAGAVNGAKALNIKYTGGRYLSAGQMVSVKPNTVYTVSAQTKGSGIEGSLTSNVTAFVYFFDAFGNWIPAGAQTTDASGSFTWPTVSGSWTSMTSSFRTPENAKTSYVEYKWYSGFYLNGLLTGEVFLDNAMLQEGDGKLGRVSSRTDALGRTTTYTYKTVGADLEVTTQGPRPGVAASKSLYNEKNQMLVNTDSAGRTTNYGYDITGFLGSVRDPQNRETIYQNNGRGNAVVVTKLWMTSGGNKEYFTFAPNTDIVTQYRNARSSGPGDNTYLTSYGYDAQNRPTSETDPTGKSKLWTYTSGTEPAIGGAVGQVQPKGLRKTTTDRTNVTVSYGYSVQGDKAQEIDPASGTTRTSFDELGRPFKVVHEASGAIPAATTDITYDVRSNARTVTLPAAVNIAGVVSVTHQLRITTEHDNNGNPISVVQSDVTAGSTDLPRTVTTQFDELDRPTLITAENGKTTRLGYDEVGNVISKTDPRGLVTTTTYDDRNLPLKTIVTNYADVVGGAIREVTIGDIKYDIYGRPFTSTDSLGRVTEFTHDDVNRTATSKLKGFRNRDSTTRDVVLSYREFDPVGNVTLERVGGTGPGVATTTHAYDARDFETSRTVDPGGLARVTTISPDSEGRTTSISTGVASQSWIYEPGTARLLSTTIPGAGTDSFTYDGWGRQDTSTNRRSFTTNYEYDPLNRVNKIISPAVTTYDPTGSTATIVRPTALQGYDTFGAITDRKDPRGLLTKSTFDTSGRLAQTTYPTDGTITPTETYGYDARDNVVSFKNRRGFTTTTAFDLFNRARTITEPVPAAGQQAPITQQTFDDAGQLTKVTMPDLAVTNYTYDDLGRQRTQTQVVRQPTIQNVITTTDYDDLGNVILTIDANGKSTSATYNNASQPKQTVDELAVPTDYTYAPHTGWLESVTINNQRKTRYGYDTAGRKKTQEQMNTAGSILATDQWTYYETGPAKTHTRPNGAVDDFILDQLDRMTGVNTMVAAAVGPTPASYSTTTAGYDVAGNVVRIVDPRNYVTRMSYNNWGLLASTIEPATTAFPNAADGTWTSTFDAGGLSKTETRPGGVTVTRNYDDLGRMTSETGVGTNAVSATHQWAYDAMGRVETSGALTGSPDTFTYDDRGSLLTATGGSGTSSFQYDPLARMKKRTDSFGTTDFLWTDRSELKTITSGMNAIDQGYNAFGEINSVLYPNGVNRTLEYDDLGRVFSDQTVKSAAVLARTQYDYYPDSAVKTKTVTLPGNASAGVSNYFYDYADRLTSVTGIGVNTYGYDKAGNRTTASGVTTTFDQRNRILKEGNKTYSWSARGTMLSEGGGGNTYTYDGLDRLTSVKTTLYTYDNMDRVRTRKAGNAAATTFTYAGGETDPVDDSVAKYQRTPAGRPVGQTRGGLYRMLGTDRHTDINWALDPSTGVITDTKTNDAYGRPLTATGTVPQLGFQSDYTDPTNGMVWMAARWYNPNTGTFLSRDTYAGQLGTAFTMNRYIYGLNNPLSYTDPTGHRALLGEDLRIEHQNRASGTVTAIMSESRTILAYEAASVKRGDAYDMFDDGQQASSPYGPHKMTIVDLQLQAIVGVIEGLPVVARSGNSDFKITFVQPTTAAQVQGNMLLTQQRCGDAAAADSQGNQQSVAVSDLCHWNAVAMSKFEGEKIPTLWEMVKPFTPIGSIEGCRDAKTWKGQTFTCTLAVIDTLTWAIAFEKAAVKAADKGVETAVGAAAKLEQIATKALPDPVAEAQAAAAKIRGGGGKTPTMTSAAVDSSTGKVYTGTSGYNGSVPPEINLPNPSKTPWSAANCAEVAACSAAIADGAKLENLQVATVRTRTGVVAPPCPNCQTWVPGKKP